MPPEKRRTRHPINHPEITSVIYAHPEANAALARISSPEDIDAFVKYLRGTFFSKWLGYKPPLVIDRPAQLSKTMNEAAERGLLTPDNFASALWNHSFRAYDGTVNNLRASFVPFDPDLTVIHSPYVHRLSAVTIVVRGDMHSETGHVEGEARKKYSLVLRHLGLPNVLPAVVLDQALRFYTREELWNHRAVYLSTGMENAGEVRNIITTAFERVSRSRMIAESIERSNTNNPMPGGLVTGS